MFLLYLRPAQMSRGPEPLDRLEALSLSKWLVERASGLAHGYEIKTKDHAPVSGG